MRKVGTCRLCGDDLMGPEKGQSGGAGYASRTADNGDEYRICYRCTAIFDADELVKAGEGMGYLTRRDGAYVFTNWTGHLSREVFSFSESRHNFNCTRTDFWFTMPGDGFVWHGYQIGDWDEVARVKRTKRAADASEYWR